VAEASFERQMCPPVGEVTQGPFRNLAGETWTDFAGPARSHAGIARGKENGRAPAEPFPGPWTVGHWNAKPNRIVFGEGRPHTASSDMIGVEALLSCPRE